MLDTDAQFMEAGPETGRGGVALFLPLRKQGKQVIGERMSTVMCVSREDTTICPRFWLSRFAALTAHERPIGRPSILFSEPDADGDVVAVGYSYAHFTRDLRALMVEAGVADADEYAGRGFRAGAHSDLAADCVSFETIAHLGGWRSSETQRLYKRMACSGFRHLSAVIH